MTSYQIYEAISATFLTPLLIFIMVTYEMTENFQIETISQEKIALASTHTYFKLIFDFQSILRFALKFHAKYFQTKLSQAAKHFVLGIHTPMGKLVGANFLGCFKVNVEK